MVEVLGRSVLALFLLAGVSSALADSDAKTNPTNIFQRPLRPEYVLQVVDDKARGKPVAIVSARYYRGVFETVDELKLGLSKLPEGSLVFWRIHKNLPPGAEKFKDACDSIKEWCAKKKIEFRCLYFLP